VLGTLTQRRTRHHLRTRREQSACFAQAVAVRGAVWLWLWLLWRSTFLRYRRIGPPACDRVYSWRRNGRPHSFTHKATRSIAIIFHQRAYRRSL
jgi:hypothetical protein